MTIPTLPAYPTAADRTNFPVEAEAFSAALPAWGVEVQAQADAIMASITAATSSDQFGTSTTSLAIGIASKTLTTQSGKRWVPGMRLRISDSTGVNLMDGEVTSYSTTTLIVAVDRIEGTGTIASWNIMPIGLVGPAGPNTLTNTDISGAKVVGFFAEYDNGVSGTAKTITLTNGQKQKISLTGNATLTVNFTAALVGTYQLRMIQDATGGRTVTWSGLTATRWLGSATAPAINAAINGETIVNIFWDGANASQSASKVGAV